MDLSTQNATYLNYVLFCQNKIGSIGQPRHTFLSPPGVSRTSEVTTVYWTAGQDR